VLTSSPTWLAVAGALFVATFFALLLLAQKAVRVSLALAGTVALALFVCFEVCLLNLLSPFGAVTRVGLLLPHVALVAATLVMWPAAARSLAARIGRELMPRVDLRTLVLGALLALVMLSAFRYPPNNGDSMEYHLARVAHWIQYGSVARYPTSSLRQTAMAPGAEYLVLLLQGIAGSDRLSALVQLWAFALVVLSAPALARLAGAPKSIAALAAPLMACLPIGLLQASSTQNDALAAAMAVATIASILPFLRGRPRADAIPRAVVLGAVLAAAALVKATAVVAALPFLAITVLRWTTAVPRRLRVWAIAVGACVPILLGGLESRRAAALQENPSVVSAFTYGPLDDLADRMKNSIRGMARSVPTPEGWLAAVGPVPFPHASAALIGQLGPLVPQEDFAGNPVHAVLAVCALGMAAARMRSIPRRARWAVSGLAVAWVLFHAVFRDNAYASRLQVPLFALSPMFLGVLGTTPTQRRLRWVLWSMKVAVLVAFALALLMAAGNYARPPLLARPGAIEESYYRTFGAERTREPQLRTLRAARQLGCRRIGIFMGESGWDYPLTWQAMEAGMEVRPFFGPDPWPCLIYVEPGSWASWGLPQPSIPLSEAEWIAAEPYHGVQFLFVRRRSLQPAEQR